MENDNMIRLLVATKNQGKLEEIQSIFAEGGLGIKLYSLNDLNITDDCIEDGDTFEANAWKKSLFYNRFAPEGMYTVGDDSGLSVEALNGEPGVYSSRYSGPGATDTRNTAKLLEQLKGIESRQAKFVTVACLSLNNEVLATFQGEVHGEIIDEKRGTNGFGYDPVFYYPPFKKTFAQLTTAEKNQISHRARAFEQLRKFYLSLGA